MAESPKPSVATRRDFVYAGKAQTKILLEQPSEKNPYVSQKNYLHGYDVADLVQKKSFSETLMLLFTGQLPSTEQADLLERLMVALIDIGPRHPAVKASMVAGVSKSNAEHLLPIGLSVLGGQDNGAQEVGAAVAFIKEHIGQPASKVAEQLLSKQPMEPSKGEFHLCPGFGNCYGSIDVLTRELAEAVLAPYRAQTNDDSLYINWVTAFMQALQKHELGLLRTGLAAMVFCQLGIGAREAVGLFQLLCAPGIFAHGVEQTHKPITAMPMLSDEQHVFCQDK